MEAVELDAELKAVLRTGFLVAVAIVLPPKRLQAHDDDDPTVVHPYEIGTIPSLVLFNDEPGRDAVLKRASVVAGVVITNDSTWAMLNLDKVNPQRPDFLEFVGHLREACDQWGHESVRKLNDDIDRELRKERA